MSFARMQQLIAVSTSWIKTSARSAASMSSPSAIDSSSRWIAISLAMACDVRFTVGGPSFNSCSISCHSLISRDVSVALVLTFCLLLSLCKLDCNGLATMFVADAGAVVPAGCRLGGAPMRRFVLLPPGGPPIM